MKKKEAPVHLAPSIRQRIVPWGNYCHRIVRSFQACWCTGARGVAVTLLAQQTGEYTLRISHMRDASVEQELVAECAVCIEEACACAGTSTVTGFWPEQGALAGVPAGFIVQVVPFVRCPKALNGCLKPA